MSELKITWHLEVLPIKSLKDHEKNPRQISKDQFQHLSGLIAKFGLIDKPIVNKDWIIIGGHQRIKVLKKMKAKTVECWVPDEQLEQEDIDHLCIGLNLNQGTFDWDILANEWEPLDLLKWGFTEEQLLGKMEDVQKIESEDLEEDNETLEPCKDEDAITKLGDIYELDDHRLICGNCLDSNVLEKLLDGNNIDMVYTDPPYGIDEETDRDFSSRTRKCKGNKFSKIIGDDSIITAINSYKICEQLNIPVMIWWGANYYAHSIPQSGNWLVWDKRVEENQTDMNSDCELAWIKSKNNSVRIFRHLWKGMIKGSEHGQKRVHPTQKPIELAKWCIKKYGDKQKNILDMFVGSGSTLLACELLKKIFFGIELSPAYCDVIVKRYIKLIGKSGMNAIIKRNGEIISHKDFL